MPGGSTFTDSNGNTWTVPSGSEGGGTYNTYFFAGPESNVPPPMVVGWSGIYGTYNGQQGGIVSVY